MSPLFGETELCIDNLFEICEIVSNCLDWDSS